MKKILILTMLMFVVPTTVTATPMRCDNPGCTWVVDEPSVISTWVDTTTIQSGYTYSEETVIKKPKKPSVSSMKSGGINHSYRCYRGQQDDYDDYKDHPGFSGYTVQYITMPDGQQSKNPFLFKDGKQERECDFIYRAVSKKKSNKHNGGHSSLTHRTKWETTTESGYWKDMVIETGHWYCPIDPVGPDPSTPVPEPGTMVLFGTGLIGLATIAKIKRNKR